VTSTDIGVLQKSHTHASDSGKSTRTRSPSESCAKIKKLGFTASSHIKMYGERFEIVSDPFVEGDCVAIHAITGNDPKIRTLRLPIAILLGLADRFRKPADGTRKWTSRFGLRCGQPHESPAATLYPEKRKSRHVRGSGLRRLRTTLTAAFLKWLNRTELIVQGGP
jgi:hypothetical protein